MKMTENAKSFGVKLGFRLALCFLYEHKCQYIRPESYFNRLHFESFPVLRAAVFKYYRTKCTNLLTTRTSKNLNRKKTTK